ncbi:hypothetical protein PVAP13_1NG097744 [Panicum virgatum]|uniref:C2 domain-containing protein n=1 Tax=Panicum virgatum TaxID=38727 RepID=A0A8T0WI66_PANVG|nr:hypothetical protein PVAP13_1NG097744 [Panicum virgatum]
MIEFIGILNVKVIGGTNLAIRDMSSSDPYVVLTLGHQKAQTSVIKGNLNPVWNEELKLSVPRQHGPLKLQVFDHDMVSKDDLMGEAEIDLQTMINAAAAFGDPELLGDIQIGRWLKSEDNALVRDSAVVVAGDKVKQEVALRLQHTESSWSWKWSGCRSTCRKVCQVAHFIFWNQIICILADDMLLCSGFRKKKKINVVVPRRIRFAFVAIRNCSVCSVTGAPQ